MKRTVLTCILFALLIIAESSDGSQATCRFLHMEISLLTCAPGTELYSLFGHTAIRVRDARQGNGCRLQLRDVRRQRIPMFYIKFYAWHHALFAFRRNLRDFMQEYQYEHRPVD